MKRLLLAFALVLLVVSALGCHRTRIINRQGGGTVSTTYNHRWHHNIIAGIVDLSGTVDINHVCPDGAWSEIHVKETFLNRVVWMITSFIYTPQNVTIYCAGGYAYDAVIDGHGKVHYLQARRE